MKMATGASGGFLSLESGAGAHPEIWTSAIDARLRREFAQMQETLGGHADRDTFMALQRWTSSTLARIGQLVAEGAIVLSPGSVSYSDVRRGRRPLRLGVFPTAGDPLHWVHLLAGLAALERFRLDKVVYVIAGDDPRKPNLAPAFLRHHIAERVLDIFKPLFEFWPVALDSAEPGEVNVFRILGSYSGRAVHAFYLAGSDHYHRFAPLTGSPDTVEKLEAGVRARLHEFNPRTHKLSAVFIRRGDCGEAIDSPLDVRWIDGLPLGTSSTLIRGALGGQRPRGELAALPFTAYCAIRAQGMYQAGPDIAPVTRRDLAGPDAEEQDRHVV